MNSPATSVARLRTHRSAIVAWLLFSRKNAPSHFWSFATESRPRADGCDRAKCAPVCSARRLQVGVYASRAGKDASVTDTVVAFAPLEMSTSDASGVASA